MGYRFNWPYLGCYFTHRFLHIYYHSFCFVCFQLYLFESIEISAECPELNHNYESVMSEFQKHRHFQSRLKKSQEKLHQNQTGFIILGL